MGFDATRRTALLLDLNSTFMFGEDRFGPEEDYAATFAALRTSSTREPSTERWTSTTHGATATDADIRRWIEAAYAYLEERYPDPAFHRCFPSVYDALRAVAPEAEPVFETLVATFAAHERGTIPAEYADAIRALAKRFRLGLVIDIWAPKDPWEEHLSEVGLAPLFESVSYSSDHGCVKPSPRGFLDVLAALDVAPEDALFIGDSARRDLGGARAAGLDCVLVGGATAKGAVACYPDLLAFTRASAPGRA